MPVVVAGLDSDYWLEGWSVSDNVDVGGICLSDIKTICSFDGF